MKREGDINIKLLIRTHFRLKIFIDFYELYVNLTKRKNLI
jgi:hypothetical protein